MHLNNNKLNDKFNDLIHTGISFITLYTHTLDWCTSSREGKAFRKHSLHGKIAASVL